MKPHGPTSKTHEADPNQLPSRLNRATTDEHRRMVQKWHQVDSYNRSEQHHQRIQGFAEDTSSNQPWRADTTTKHQNNPGAAPKRLQSSFDLVHEPTGPECQEWVPPLRIPTSRHSSPLQLPTKADHSGSDQLVGAPDRSGPVPKSHPRQLILSTATTTKTTSGFLESPAKSNLPSTRQFTSASLWGITRRYSRFQDVKRPYLQQNSQLLLKFAFQKNPNSSKLTVNYAYYEPIFVPPLGCLRKASMSCPKRVFWVIFINLNLRYFTFVWSFQGKQLLNASSIVKYA